MPRFHKESPSWAEKGTVSLLLCIFLALGIYYALGNPIFSKPDEVYHYAYASHLKSGQGLPIIDTTKIGLNAHQPVEMEGHQPPFYYAMIAAVTSLLGMQDRVAVSVNPHFLGTSEGNRNPWTPAHADFADTPIFFTGRLVSLLCGALALVFAYLLVRLSLPWHIAILAAAFVGLNPQFLFIATSFSNDMAVTAIIYAGLWQLGRVLQKGLSLRRSLGLGFTIALATLTKLTGLGLLIPLGAIALWQAWKSRKEWPLLWAGIAGMLALAINGWWFWRNWTLYGNPFTTNLLPVLLEPRTTPWTWQEFRFFLSFLWKAYWLDFSPGSILFAELPVYTVIGLLCILATIGLIISLAREKAWRPLFLLTWGWFAIVLGSLLQLTSRTAIFMGGGRLLFPAAVAVGASLATGLTEFFCRRPAIPAGLVILLGLYATIAPVRYLYPVYPRPVLVDTPERPPTYPLQVRFGDNQFELMGYDLEETSNGLTITYYWRALRKSDHNYSVFIHLETREQGQPLILTQVDTYPGYGIWPTSVWQVGRVFIDRLTLPLPPPNRPFLGKVLTGLYFLPTLERLPAYDRTGQRFPADAVPLAHVWTDESGMLCLSVPDHLEE